MSSITSSIETIKSRDNFPRLAKKWPTAFPHSLTWIVRLVTTVSYYNYHLAIAYPEAEPLWVTIGGVPFTGYLYQVNQDFVLRKHILTRLKDIER